MVIHFGVQQKNSAAIQTELGTQVTNNKMQLGWKTLHHPLLQDGMDTKGSCTVVEHKLCSNQIFGMIDFELKEKQGKHCIDHGINKISHD